MLYSSLTSSVEQALTAQFEKRVEILRSRSVGGGCINQTALLETSHGLFFIKWNDRNIYPYMFEAEARGLNLLASAASLKIPEVVTLGATDKDAFLILEAIESGQMEAGFWENFGRGLARMHRVTQSTFGLDHENYIGSLSQFNDPAEEWATFFIQNRLEKQIRMALDLGRIHSKQAGLFDGLFKMMPTIFPTEKPALLHGDLWSGNYMVGNEGEPCLIDPAVYFGHREMDLGMTKLFGGFAPRFYEAYQEELPLHAGYEQRLDICNLYPLMVHVNLFGGGYWSQIESILRRF